VRGISLPLDFWQQHTEHARCWRWPCGIVYHDEHSARTLEEVFEAGSHTTRFLPFIIYVALYITSRSHWMCERRSDDFLRRAVNLDFIGLDDRPLDIHPEYRP